MRRARRSSSLLSFFMDLLFMTFTLSSFNGKRVLHVLKKCNNIFYVYQTLFDLL
jgi:hypothetical protein